MQNVHEGYAPSRHLHRPLASITMKNIYLILLAAFFLSCKTSKPNWSVENRWIMQLTNCELILEQYNNTVRVETTKELLGEFQVESIFLEPELFEYDGRNYFVIRQMSIDSVFLDDDILVTYDSDCSCEQIGISYSSSEMLIDKSKGEYTRRGKERFYADNKIIEILKIWNQESLPCCPAQTLKMKYGIVKVRDNNEVRLRMLSDKFIE